jgi:hypothetical protein
MNGLRVDADTDIPAANPAYVHHSTELLDGSSTVLVTIVCVPFLQEAFCLPRDHGGVQSLPRCQQPQRMVPAMPSTRRPSLATRKYLRTSSTTPLQRASLNGTNVLSPTALARRTRRAPRRKRSMVKIRWRGGEGEGSPCGRQFVFQYDQKVEWVARSRGPRGPQRRHRRWGRCSGRCCGRHRR